jgi:enoyl-CoA hydratase
MEYLIYEAAEGVAKITLNRPKVLNALNPGLYRELAELLEKIGEDKEIRAVVITGAGTKAFAAGADIGAMQSMTAQEARELARVGQRPLNLIASLPKPVIAAINGMALGGGCELAMACDLRIASETALLGQPEINLAVIPGGGGTQMLPRLAGLAKAKELIFTGRLIKAAEALALGLVNRVVPQGDVVPAAEKLAREICTKGPIAMALAKASINKVLETPLKAGLEYEIEAFAGCFATEDQKEGMAAFLEKRAPRIKGA